MCVCVSQIRMVNKYVYGGSEREREFDFLLRVWAKGAGDVGMFV